MQSTFRAFPRFAIFWLTLTVSFRCATAVAEESPVVWTQSGFKDFIQGRFGDGGANTYVSAKGRIQLINRWDLNDDGSIDLVFVNTHPHVEKLDATIYWGDGKDFDLRRASDIPNEGAQWTAAADIDGDGNMDAVVPNYTNGTWSKMDSYVYYGGLAELKKRDPQSTAWGFPPFARKVSLPTEAAQSAAIADLNNDGYKDIVFALSAGFWEYRGNRSGDSLESPSRIFWGSKAGFSRENYMDLEASGASDVAIEDLNRDGWQDVVFANREKAGKFDIDSFVYWGSKDGFSTSRRSELPTNQANAVALRDVNRDGFTDILFANGAGPVSYVYLSNRGSFEAGKRTEFPTSEAKDCASADLNGDSYPEIFITNHQTAQNPLTTSYLYWGGPKGFSDQRRQEFETLGAWGVSLADLNEDGRTDIVVSNNREYTSYDVPSYIFWNSEKGFSNSLRTSVFTRGAVGNTVADFNGDGHLDIIFNNTMGRTRGGSTPSYVYWGDKKGRYSPDRRIELPGVEPYDWAAGDLNDDGYPDLLFANEAEIGRRITESFVYWGGAEGYSALRRSAMVGHGGRGVGLADLDKNGHLDVIMINAGLAVPAAAAASGVFIYWGEPNGFVIYRRTELPGPGSGLPTIADLNYDGNLDIVVAGSLKQGSCVYWGNGTRNYGVDRRTEIPESIGTTNSEVADLNRDGFLDLILTRRGKDPSYVYYGNAKGEFSADPKSELPPMETQGVTVGDANNDGWLDIVMSEYTKTGSRATKSRVYLGGTAGFSPGSIIELPTNSGTGSRIADYNNDGHNDILFFCHRSEGNPNKVGAVSDHETNSFLYWGGRDGFKPDRKLGIPGRGAHYDGGVDMGNIYDRGSRFDYVSAARNIAGKTGERIEWQADTPHGSAVWFQIRTAFSRDALEKVGWVGPKGKDSYYKTSGSKLKTEPGASWIQYRAILISPNCAASPSLEKVSLSFR
ncbi:MAG: VCBS repeat-containing protein [Armatimonadota bacterium]|nr:VCBS repeat-containing protein [Armatimonadota bacterium]